MTEEQASNAPRELDKESLRRERVTEQLDSTERLRVEICTLDRGRSLTQHGREFRHPDVQIDVTKTQPLNPVSSVALTLRPRSCARRWAATASRKWATGHAAVTAARNGTDDPAIRPTAAAALSGASADRKREGSSTSSRHSVTKRSGIAQNTASESWMTARINVALASPEVTRGFDNRCEMARPT